MAEIHRDKNGNPMKGAALHSHIIYTHDGGPEAHDAAVSKKVSEKELENIWMLAIPSERSVKAIISYISL